MPDAYTTAQGDTWDMVAFRVYGDETLADRLMAANPEHRMTVIFSANATLTLPKLQPRRSGAPLPPWKS